MKHALYALMLAGALTGCSPLERADIVKDVAAYNGSADTDPAAVAVGTALKAAEKAANPLELIAYIAGLLATVAAGWVGRKWVLRKYSAPKGE